MHVPPKKNCMEEPNHCKVSNAEPQKDSLVINKF